MRNACVYTVCSVCADQPVWQLGSDRYTYIPDLLCVTPAVAWLINRAHGLLGRRAALSVAAVAVATVAWSAHGYAQLWDGGDAPRLTHTYACAQLWDGGDAPRLTHTYACALSHVHASNALAEG